MQLHRIAAAIGILLICACNSGTKTDPGKGPTSNASYLSMKINGVEWKADNEIFGAFHPNGYNNAIIITGSKGIKDKQEQSFTINLYNTTGPAAFVIANGNVNNSVVQLANMSPQNYMYGSMMGFDMKVKVTKAEKTPAAIEAVFEGQLTGNTGDILKITEGKFYYHE